VTRIKWFNQFIAAAATGAVGVLLVLEATGAVGGRWRHEISKAITRSTFPTLSLWIITLAGVGLAIVGVVMIAAQLAPPKRGLNKMHNVSKGSDGDTSLRGRAAVRAVRHELEKIEGVVDVDARVTARRVFVEMRVDDRADVSDIETLARDRLGYPFWIDLGLADFTFNLLVTHHPKPPRVR